MLYLDLTLPTVAENVALDDALQETAERAAAEGRAATEVLRVWEPREPAVVIGRASRWADEVNGPVCQQLGVPILRRSSGGAAIVTGPGCLMYAVVLSYAHYPQLRILEETHRLVLGRLAAALAPLAAGVARQGISDLAWHDQKISGNSLRCRRHTVLYHGTLLYRFPLDLVSRCLRTAPRQPLYRRGREHEAFVANLPVDPAMVRERLAAAWEVAGPLAAWPQRLVEQFVRERYGDAAWNYRL